MRILIELGETVSVHPILLNESDFEAEYEDQKNTSDIVDSDAQNIKLLL